WVPSMEELALWSTSQNPHICRFLACLVTGLSENKVRVIAPEVGGGFGSKTPMYADEMIATFCSMKLGRPVKWTETRSENYQATIHGRDHVAYVEMAATREGRITALRAVVYAGMGAYLSTASTGIPTILHGLMYSGPYDIPHIKADIYGVFTTTTPVDLYRGAGRPEATFLLERLVDLLAVEVGKDPVEVRRMNLIPKFDNGHDVVVGLTYDSGDYETSMDVALDQVNYQQLREEQAKLRENGTYTGIGVTTYCEICGLGPSQVAGAIGFGGGLWESATIRISPTGKVAVAIGANPHGQGENTTFAQILADELGVSMDDINVIYGDTDNTPMGWGTFGSRTTPVAGTAVFLSARKIIEKAKIIAAHLLEAAEADIEFADGKFSVRGSPDQSKTFQDVALMANLAWNMPEGVEPGLEATTYFDPPNFTFPFGTHIAVVQVDPDNGNIVLQRYLATDDCGPQINPMIVAGQIHGGVVQGAGQALWEGAVYDENGQLLTGSMLDYALPRAHMVPDIETFSTVTPSPTNPLGVKGIGETGTIASTITIYNAVIDALRPLGVTKLEMPLTPERVWRAIHQQE
ncbi:MAG: molybdopterin-dependent oxidoreductase, partial [Chloroflexi bacterium]|nr:molybdopterin-dependent oxidoreductase [Chloroflexota bacterium]